MTVHSRNIINHGPRCEALVMPLYSHPRDHYRCKMSATLDRDGGHRVCLSHFMAKAVSYFDDDRSRASVGPIRRR